MCRVIQWCSCSRVIRVGRAPRPENEYGIRLCQATGGMSFIQDLVVSVGTLVLHGAGKHLIGLPESVSPLVACSDSSDGWGWTPCVVGASFTPGLGA